MFRWTLYPGREAGGASVVSWWGKANQGPFPNSLGGTRRAESGRQRGHGGRLTISRILTNYQVFWELTMEMGYGREEKPDWFVCWVGFWSRWKKEVEEEWKGDLLILGMQGREERDWTGALARLRQAVKLFTAKPSKRWPALSRLFTLFWRSCILFGSCRGGPCVFGLWTLFWALPCRVEKGTRGTQTPTFLHSPNFGFLVQTRSSATLSTPSFPSLCKHLKM